SMRLFPSGVQIGAFRPRARGGPLSAIRKPPTSRSAAAVKFRGVASGERSSTHRSGWVYELIGCVVEATNATRLPSGLRDNTPESGPSCVFRSIVVIFTGLLPPVATEYRSVLGSS